MTYTADQLFALRRERFLRAQGMDPICARCNKVLDNYHAAVCPECRAVLDPSSLPGQVKQPMSLSERGKRAAAARWGDRKKAGDE